MKRNLSKSLLSGILIITTAFLVQSCNKGKVPEWAAVNKQVINEFKVEGRVRKDIPRMGVKSNLVDGKVDNIKNLPDLNLADCVVAKAYWGQGQLVSLVTMEPNAAIPESTVK